MHNCRNERLQVVDPGAWLSPSALLASFALALVLAGMLAGVPTDPSGEPYVLDQARSGGVTVARTSKLYPLPAQHLGKAGPPS